MTDEDAEMDRRSFLGSLAALPAFHPLQVDWSLGLGGDSAATRLAVYEPSEQIGFRDDDTPMFLVGLEKDPDAAESENLSTLRSYLSGSSSRYEIDVNTGFDGLDVVTMAAPSGDIGLGLVDSLLGNGLAQQDYVKFVDANISVSHPDPLATHEIVESASEISFDAPNWWASRSTPDPSGLAWSDDVEERPIGDGWVAVNGRNHGVDHSDLTIAVIDSGVNATEALQDDSGNTRLLPESANVVTTDKETGVTAAEDGNGHGTWVAESAASSHSDQAFTALLPDANILAIKALDDEGSGSTDAIIRGIEHAIEHGADASCMSLGSPLYSTAMAETLSEAVNSGMFVSVASGNDRIGTTFVASPASSDPATAVTACTAHQDVADAKIANFGNCGPHDGVLDQSGGETAGATPQLAAPGMALETPSEGVLSGTSMAAPFVFAAGGLLIADGVAPENVVDRLTRTAEPMPRAAVNETEHGRLDVAAALADKEHEDEQADVMNNAARARNESLNAYSNARGGIITRNLNRIQGLRI